MASLEEKYKKENLQNHIYNTPDTYVGGCESICEVLSIYDSDKNKIVTKEVEYIPAILKSYPNPSNGLFISKIIVNKSQIVKYVIINNDLEICYNQISDYIDSEIERKKKNYDTSLIEDHIKKLTS